MWKLRKHVASAEFAPNVRFAADGTFTSRELVSRTLKTAGGKHTKAMKLPTVTDKAMAMATVSGQLMVVAPSESGVCLDKHSQLGNRSTHADALMHRIRSCVGLSEAATCTALYWIRLVTQTRLFSFLETPCSFRSVVYKLIRLRSKPGRVNRTSNASGTSGPFA